MIIIIAVAAIGAIWYRHSLTRYPKIACPHCNGQARKWDPALQHTFGGCAKCKHRGWKIRPGVRLLMRKTAADIEAGRHSRYY